MACDACGTPLKRGDRRCRECFAIIDADGPSLVPFATVVSAADQAPANDTSVLLATVDDLPDRRIVAVLGTVTGSTVRTGHILSKMAAGVRDMVGGEQIEMTRIMDAARNEAIARMLAAASTVGADAIVGFRLATSDISAGSTEILAYGTAVVTELTQG